ncbi:MAG TPA: DUF3667 domain-containing protein [Rhodanobacteraceae bacterium]|nr:DUF3667 domain-containing protein [Rhodanobacteraceae bacterium]
MHTEISKPSTPSVDTATPPAACENCGAPLYGKYCYACGQPVHGLVRHFSSVLADVTDSVFNIDERLFRTIAPLYFRPGKLTLDYFEGKRARYVTPFRLVFFLAIIAFFSLQLSFRMAEHDSPVIALNDSGIHTLSPQALPKDQDQTFSNDQIRIDDKVVWDANKHPLQVDWLPGFANDWLNGLIANARINLHRMNSGTSADKVEAARQMMARMFSVAPTVLFVLLPFFALLLKIFYIFKKRLYMEHLIVAMHSHAFLMLSTLVLVLLMLLRHWLNAYAGWLAIPVNLAEAAAWIWIFVYLFLMQKRVYRQGWIMTTVKYWCVGWCYSILVVFGLIFAALASLTST